MRNNIMSPVRGNCTERHAERQACQQSEKCGERVWGRGCLCCVCTEPGTMKFWSSTRVPWCYCNVIIINANAAAGRRARGITKRRSGGEAARLSRSKGAQELMSVSSPEFYPQNLLLVHWSQRNCRENERVK